MQSLVTRKIVFKRVRGFGSTGRLSDGHEKRERECLILLEVRQECTVRAAL